MLPARLAPPADLTLPAGGSTTVSALLAAALRQAMATALSIGAAREGPRLDPGLRKVLGAEPGLLAASLRQPSRLVLARCLALHPAAPERDAWASELGALLALNAGERGLLPPGFIEVQGTDRPLLSGWTGRAYHAPGALRWRIGNARIEVETPLGLGRFSPDAPLEDIDRSLGRLGGWARASHAGELHAEATLQLEDNNPFAGLEAHPDKRGSHVDLGGHPAAAWRAALTGAFAIIDRHLPEISREMRLFLRHVVPVGYHDERHESASYLEASGVVYLSLHPQPMTLVEALVHEFQHNKLNLLLGFDPVLANGSWPLYGSPVRPDPRPLRGVLLAVHAFQPLVRLYERLAGAPGGQAHGARLGAIARLCREGCEVLLTHGEPTAMGAPLLAEIRALDRAFAVHLGR